MSPSTNVDPIEDVISKLKQGSWTIEGLENEFRNAIATKLNLGTSKNWGNFSTTHLCSKLYKQMSIPTENRFSPKPKLQIVGVSTNDDENKYWVNAVNCLKRDAVLANCSDEWKNTFNDALKKIEQTSIVTRANLDNISYVCTVETEAFKSASHPHYFSCLFLKKTTDAVALSVSIVHELAHQELFLINTIDRLINKPKDLNLAHAPYQNKMRPPIGRLHSAHALFRMVQFEKLANYCDLRRHEDLLKQTVESFSEDEITDFTRKLIYEVYA